MNYLRSFVLTVVVAVVVVLAHRIAADEGMWPLNRLPAAQIQQKHGFTPTRQWLEHAQLASVRLPGCSGSIVSSTEADSTQEPVTAARKDAWPELIERRLIEGWIHQRTSITRGAQR